MVTGIYTQRVINQLTWLLAVKTVMHYECLNFAVMTCKHGKH